MQLCNLQTGTVRPAGLRSARATPAFTTSVRSNGSAVRVQQKSGKMERRSSSIVKAVAQSSITSASSSTTTKPMDIVFISAEIAPWSKTGGLADVCGSLPVELAYVFFPIAITDLP